MQKTWLAIAAAALSLPALAQYPEKPVTIIVPFAAGGPTDKVARDLAEALRKGLNNQTVVIENVGGAGGTLGAAKVAKAAPDGYTLGMAYSGLSINPAVMAMPFDTLKDLTHLVTRPRLIHLFNTRLIRLIPFLHHCLQCLFPRRNIRWREKYFV